MDRNHKAQLKPIVLLNSNTSAEQSFKEVEAAECSSSDMKEIVVVTTCTIW